MQEHSSNIASNGSKSVRGLTQGKGILKIVQQVGPLPMPFCDDFCAPMGPNASKLASEIGVNVRRYALVVGIKRWSEIDDVYVDPIYKHITDKFDLQGDVDIVKKSMTTKCG